MQLNSIQRLIKSGRCVVVSNIGPDRPHPSLPSATLLLRTRLSSRKAHQHRVLGFEGASDGVPHTLHSGGRKARTERRKAARAAGLPTSAGLATRRVAPRLSRSKYGPHGDLAALASY